jgi:predicted XRE-type DNA-binding protein
MTTKLTRPISWIAAARKEFDKFPTDARDTILDALTVGTTMKDDEFALIRGSGNVYRDFAIEDADVRQLKALLASEIIKTLEKQHLSVRKAHSLTGIDAADFSRIRNADFRRLTVERLMKIVNRLGSRIEFKMRLRPISVRNRFAQSPQERPASNRS